ncbi:Retrovirus-related Pol poly from transposon [Paramuricea clavata]|uniref:Retrovirus-related Pol poly from transposon n=1 Tax=Paramuricea clavata TaxID=317549 RepID=A0A7D9E2T3_PARCT|nr:Retrovirus-related Pol poly from transposon [Paramuricea clavata]
MLNQFVQRENHPLPTTDTTFANFAGARYFTKLDANSGFWQIKLSERSKPLTTFITPWGRYCFNVLPFGISSGSEKFQKYMCQILEGLDGVECNIDDVLVHGATQEEHDGRLEAVLQRLVNANVTLNAEKCVFNVSSVKFLGQIVGADGIKPDPEKIQAILEMPHPTNLHEVRSFLGMVNQFSKFTTNLADLTKPIRELLVKNTAWTWGPPQQDAFDKIKKALTSAPILTLYDPNKATKIAADASSYGLGAVVLQEEEPDTWKPVSFISRSMTTTEARYAQIEKEALAVTWACEVTSKTTTLQDETNEIPHQRCSTRTGKLHYTADTLSRKIPESTVQPTVEENEMNAYVLSVINALPASNPRLKEIQQAQDEDEVCKEVKKYCMDQWPEKDHVTPAVKPYWSVQGELTIADELLLKGTRLVIPSRLQRQTLNQIHEGHQGISKCRERAKISVWWPGLSAQIKVMLENCTTCSKYRQQHPEPLMPTPLPQRPWQLIATDLFILEKVTYLLVVDYYSRYVEVVALPKSTSSSKITQALKTIFARHGIPDEVRSDNGPQYHSDEFAQFAKEWGFKHSTSSPRYPQANGEVERTVKTVKNILKKEQDPTKALLAYRSTPLASGYSPAELLMGRKIKSTIPITLPHLTPQLPNQKLFIEKEEVYRSKQKKNFDNRHKAQPLKPLPPGATAYITDMDCTGTVIRPSKKPRSYLVDTPTTVVDETEYSCKTFPRTLIRNKTNRKQHHH